MLDLGPRKLSGRRMLGSRPTGLSIGLDMKTESGKDEFRMTPWLRNQAGKIAAPFLEA